MLTTDEHARHPHTQHRPPPAIPRPSRLQLQPNWPSRDFGTVKPQRETYTVCTAENNQNGQRPLGMLQEIMATLLIIIVLACTSLGNLSSSPRTSRRSHPQYWVFYFFPTSLFVDVLFVVILSRTFALLTVCRMGPVYHAVVLMTVVFGAGYSAGIQERLTSSFVGFGTCLRSGREQG